MTKVIVLGALVLTVTEVLGRLIWGFVYYRTDFLVGVTDSEFGGLLIEVAIHLMIWVPFAFAFCWWFSRFVHSKEDKTDT